MNEGSSMENFIKKLEIGNYEIMIKNKKLKNPMDLLEKLYLTRDDKNLKDEEKIAQVRKIVNEYME
ncbi:MAG: hypothetical protein ACOX7R_06525 [Acetivibrionales bacterium]|jgi:hypothetical protein